MRKILALLFLPVCTIAFGSSDTGGHRPPYDSIKITISAKNVTLTSRGAPKIAEKAPSPSFICSIGILGTSNLESRAIRGEPVACLTENAPQLFIISRNDIEKMQLSRDTKWTLYYYVDRKILEDEDGPEAWPIFKKELTPDLLHEILNQGARKEISFDYDSRNFMQHYLEIGSSDIVLVKDGNITLEPAN